LVIPSHYYEVASATFIVSLTVFEFGLAWLRFGEIPDLAPRKVDAYVSYPWGTNLFMLLAVPIFFITIILLMVRMVKGPPVSKS